MRTFDVKQVLNLLHSSLPESLLEKYGLTLSQTKDATHIGDVMQPIFTLQTDQLFSAGIDRFNREISKTEVKAYSYHFDRGNPFLGSMHYIAHHALDLEYVFGNFIEGFPDQKDVNLSKELMGLWIRFANGGAPWADYTSRKALHITPDAELRVIPRKEITSRRWDAYAEMEKFWGTVSRVGNMLMHGNLDG